jgi:hypothetical protein
MAVTPTVTKGFAPHINTAKQQFLMAPSSTAKPKEKLFHPSSRKAGQLARNALRKGKLGNLSSKRSKKYHSLGRSRFFILSKFLTWFSSLVDLYGFFYHAMPEEGVLSLQDLHHIISDIWLTRFDEDLEKERSTRRKGRPKSLKEIKLEELKFREAELYRTGMGMQPPLKKFLLPENWFPSRNYWLDTWPNGGDFSTMGP